MEYEDDCEGSLPRKYPKNVYYQEGRPHQLKKVHLQNLSRAIQKGGYKYFPVWKFALGNHQCADILKCACLGICILLYEIKLVCRQKKTLFSGKGERLRRGTKVCKHYILE